MYITMNTALAIKMQAMKKLPPGCFNNDCLPMNYGREGNSVSETYGSTVSLNTIAILDKKYTLLPRRE